VKRLTAVLAALVAVAAGLVPVLADPAPAPASAATAAEMLQSFNPGDIISDQVMFNSGAMSASAVQSFLNGKVTTCTAVQHSTGLPCLKDYHQDTRSLPADPMCAAYTGAKNESAATILVKVAKACRVNPQVLLVVLQKEQGLVTDTWPTSEQYRKATGYGCPDTAPCDAEYNGFFNQLYKAAWAMERYTMPPGTGPGTDYYTNYGAMYAVGTRSAILYNPSTSCGAKMVTIANKATHALYVYTPYTPNAAALAAGWGTATCGAYGNRNFFLYFTSWFGSTHYTVTGAMKTAWTAAGGATGVLGNPTGNAVATTASGGGSYQVFQHGRIYSSGAGTFVLTGAINSRYVALKGPASVLKWPRAAAATSSANGGGTVQSFQGGLLAARAGASTAYPVTGAVLSEYAARQAQAGSVGWPTGDAKAVTGGLSQSFTRGVIVQKTGAAAHAVLASLYTDYVANGGTAGVLGWPTAGWRGSTASGGGTTQAFEHGGLYHSAKGGYAVTGDLATAYTRTGGPGGTLNWPSSGGVSASGGTKQTFVGGSLYQPVGKSVLPVTSPFIAEYRRVGADGGPLGWPTTAKASISVTGTVSAAAATTTASLQQFQKGAIYGVPLGNFSVAGAVYVTYLAHKGPAGSLGVPMRVQWTHTKNGGGVSQKFAGGYVFSSPKAGTRVVNGAILREYLRRGGVGGSLAWPAADAKRTTTKSNGAGYLQTFQSGSIYSSGRGAFAVRGSILKAYLAKGGPSSRLGWPTSSAHAVSGVTTQTFQHGRITWTPAGGAVVHY
jgi:uncharacterized protein with LGFP repeats